MATVSSGLSTLPDSHAEVMLRFPGGVEVVEYVESGLGGLIDLDMLPQHRLQLSGTAADVLVLFNRACTARYTSGVSVRGQGALGALWGVPLLFVTCTSPLQPAKSTQFRLFPGLICIRHEVCCPGLCCTVYSLLELAASIAEPIHPAKWRIGRGCGPTPTAMVHVCACGGAAPGIAALQQLLRLSIAV